MELNVTKATPDDVSELVRLYTQALDGQEGQRGAVVFQIREARSGPMDQSFQDALSAENCELWLGTMEGEPFGFLSMHTEVLRDDTTHAVIDEIYVEEPARAVGLGELLMETAVEWATEQDAHSMDAFALPGDRNTKNFFEMSGFTARLLIMHKTLKARD